MVHDDRHHEHGGQRTCRRTGCNRPAGASLSFRYETRQVWVSPLGDERSGNRYDLCAGHADSLTVPKGWHRVDERSAPRRAPRAHGRAGRSPRQAPSRPAPPARTASQPPPAPARTASQPPPAPARTASQPPPAPAPVSRPDPTIAQEPPAGTVPDRYARLLSELPRLAAEMLPVPARDTGHTAPAALQADMIGQLTMPVGDRTPTEAVVVSLEDLFGARRRAERDSLPT